MVKINFQNNITKANADTFNTMQNNIEEAIDDNTSSINALDTKVDRNSTYSTTETKIGTWIDGKPLYRKVLPITTPNTTSNTQIETFDSTYNIQNYYGKVLISASQQYLDINFYFTAEYNVATYVIQNTHSINMKVGSNAYTSQSGYIVLEYTKTTD